MLSLPDPARSSRKRSGAPASSTLVEICTPLRKMSISVPGIFCRSSSSVASNAQSTSWIFLSSLIALRSIFDAIRILMRLSLSDSVGMWHGRFLEGRLSSFSQCYRTITVNTITQSCRRSCHNLIVKKAYSAGRSGTERWLLSPLFSGAAMVVPKPSTPGMNWQSSLAEAYVFAAWTKASTLDRISSASSSTGRCPSRTGH